MKIIVKIARFFISKLIGIENIENMILFVCRLSGINFLMLAYQNMGILKYKNNFVSGEHFVISNILEKNLKKENPIFFDVGANIGEYSKELRQQFTKATIYAFEPNINTYKLLSANLLAFNIKCFNIGLSSKAAKEKIYTYATEQTSGHASIYQDVLTTLHGAKDILEIEFMMDTIDSYCNTNKIDSIDFLKIDTEGHELEVLKGASEMIKHNKINIIQFEFNEMNIISRVFLKDFYQLLSSYDIYRLDSNKLIPLGEYNSINEIFKFQNLLAVNKTCINIMQI